ncbi:hypothetical protein [Trichloromonas sp.]|uniref:hypothetical protein n=1 Tax=Trichloromonas sp. TaxID=3069249 RepID=UPI002A42FBB4|nr:hypothetical protein [Trichloromonas sp.]
MSKSVLGARMIQKLTDVFDVSPFGNNPGENYNTIGDDHTMGWPDNAIYKGELFLNTYENRAWTRTDHGIIEFIMEDKDTGKIPDRFMPDIIVGTGTVTSVTAGNGMDFTDITSTGQVTMGLPSDITSLTSNSLTSNSHTHKFVPAGSDGHIQYKMSDNLVSSSALRFDDNSLYISGTTYNENDHMLYFDQSNGKITYGNKPQSIITGITYINTSEVIIDSYDSSLNNYQVYHYCVYSGTTNLRAGTIVLVNNTIISNIVDTSTNDIGDTSNISFSSDINSGNVRLKILSSNGEWYCKFIKLID